MKILIVDDDEIARVPLVSLVLRLPGVSEVVEATDGEEAWALLAAGLRPALCCCDLSMPRLSGVELLKRAKGDVLLASMPFVMISSSADRGSVTGAVEAGAVGFIVKPFASGAIQRTLERVLQQSRANHMEPLTQVARRLDIAKSDVVRLLRKLHSDVLECVERLEQEGDAGAHRPAIQRIQGSCALLGLKHCASLLKTDPGTSIHEYPGELVLLKEVRLQLTQVLEIEAVDA